jgi:NAD(P)H-flavin reductase
VAYPHTRPEVVHRRQHLPPQERLPEEVTQFILDADTVFIGSIYKSTASEFPSHAGMNARSGLPGFIRVSPSDGRTVVIPDYSGNRFLSSLGNIESSGVVGLTIVSFITGDIVYLTGTAENFVGPPALKIMARHASLTSMNVTGFTFVRDALPVRQQMGTSPERSPYSPKVKYLVEEAGSQMGGDQQHKAQLQEAVQLSSDLAVFKFKINSVSGANELKIRPGQAIVLDFMDWIGPPRYQHMANSAPASINDDRVRTWTVSSAHEEQKVMTWFKLTMREIQGGAVTGALFDLLRKDSSNKLGHLISFDIPVSADIVGITGDFFMSQGKLNMLLVAGGIGLTPFLAMLSALAERGPKAEGHVALVLATREPESMVSLMKPSLEKMPSTVKIEIALFTNDSKLDIEYLNTPSRKISKHTGRVIPEYWKGLSRDKEVFICGPNGFGDSVTDGLRAAGFPLTQIHREGFY